MEQNFEQPPASTEIFSAPKSFEKFQPRENSEEKKEAVEFFETKMLQIEDALEYLGIKLPSNLQDLLQKIFSSEEAIPLSELRALPFPKDTKPLDIIKTLALLTEKKIHFLGPKEKLAYFFAKNLLPQKNGFSLFRAAKFLKQEGKQRLRVAYPGSGQDSSGYLEGITSPEIATVDTFGLDQTVDSIGNNRIQRRKKEHHYHYGNFHTTIENKPELHGVFDIAVIETRGAAGAISNFSGDITRILQPGGILVVTKIASRKNLETALYGNVFSKKDKKTTMQEEYECVGETSSHLFYRKKSQDTAENIEFQAAA